MGLLGWHFSHLDLGGMSVRSILLGGIRVIIPSVILFSRVVSLKHMVVEQVFSDLI